MESDRPPLDRFAIAVLAAAAIGAAIGWLLGTPLAAVGLGTVLALTTAAVMAAARLRGMGKALDGPAPDLSQLAPRQVLATLGAMVGGTQFDSPQMRALQELADATPSDPHADLRATLCLVEQYPRSPLVFAELSRRHRALDQQQHAGEAAACAVRFALDGGMNPMAAALLIEFRYHRGRFDLSAEHRMRLAGAARCAGDDSGAAWCLADPAAHGDSGSG